MARNWAAMSSASSCSTSVSVWESSTPYRIARRRKARKVRMRSRRTASVSIAPAYRSATTSKVATQAEIVETDRFSRLTNASESPKSWAFSSRGTTKADNAR